MVDMINFLYSNPEIISSEILSSCIGFDENDLSYDALVIIKHKEKTIPIYFIAHDHRKYNLIELNIFCTELMVKYTNSKAQIEYYPIVNDANFPSYKVFQETPIVHKVDNAFMMLNAYKTLNNILTNKAKNISSFDDELANQTFIYSLLKGL